MVSGIFSYFSGFLLLYIKQSTDNSVLKNNKIVEGTHLVLHDTRVKCLTQRFGHYMLNINHYGHHLL